jgi:hypothetical protein
MIAEDCFGYRYSREEEVRRGRENYKKILYPLPRFFS